jgi:hypothetical protein
MNFPSAFSSTASDETAPVINRREALKRAALLLGAAISPSILSGVARAQSPGAARSAKTVFLSAAQLATVGAVAERIFPKTATPGALDAGVPGFIDLMAGGYLTAAEQARLTEGLADVEALSKAAHGRGFGEIGAAQQDALLKKLATESAEKSQAFFRQMRELTIVGYFTSELVGKTVLHYDPVPGRYDGCIPISEVGNVNWTR